MDIVNDAAGEVIIARISGAVDASTTPELKRFFTTHIQEGAHQFVADLEQKDKRTRDHTIRTGEMALRVGERMRMSPNDLRELGLAGVGVIEEPRRTYPHRKGAPLAQIS